MDKPRIRPVEVFPIEQEDHMMVCLRDAMGLAPEPVCLGMGAYFLVTQFDGTNSVVDLQAAFARRFGAVIPSEQVRQLIEALDNAYYLDSPRFAERRQQVIEEFRQSAARPPTHAGLCYEREPERLRKELAAYFETALVPATIPSARADGALSGLIAPHIDPRRGGATYAHAYAELMGRQAPELVIILGTSHYCIGPELFAATRKDYGTPLGALSTDGEFLDRLARRYHRGDLFADELLHRNEHSIEFQTLFLAWALGTEGFQIVPILVGSFREMVLAGAMPLSDGRVGPFIEALKATLDEERRRTLVIAAVDLAHVGRKFGDSFAIDDGVIDRVKGEDLALIEFIKRGDPAGFFTEVSKDKDARKICGLAPIYVQLELLRGRPARLLKYDVAREPQTDSAVTFASLALG